MSFHFIAGKLIIRLSLGRLIAPSFYLCFSPCVIFCLIVFVCSFRVKSRVRERRRNKKKHVIDYQCRSRRVKTLPLKGTNETVFPLRRRFYSTAFLILFVIRSVFVDTIASGSVIHSLTRSRSQKCYRSTRKDTISTAGR